MLGCVHNLSLINFSVLLLLVIAFFVSFRNCYWKIRVSYLNKKNKKKHQNIKLEGWTVETLLLCNFRVPHFRQVATPGRLTWSIALSRNASGMLQHLLLLSVFFATAVKTGCFSINGSGIISSPLPHGEHFRLCFPVSRATYLNCWRYRD